MSDPTTSFQAPGTSTQTSDYIGVSLNHFAGVQKLFDDDADFRERIKPILKDLDRSNRELTALLSRSHSLTPSQWETYLSAHSPTLFDTQKNLINKLMEVAKTQPFYKYNQLWSKDLQNCAYLVILAGWLGYAGYSGRLVPQEKVVEILGIPQEAGRGSAEFWMTDEEYLHACVSLVEELARLAVNSVIVGDYGRPMIISQFVKDLHAAFQVLNLKNDSLRKRTDGLKYSVKKIEDVVYDLRLRNLVGTQ
ncbi:Translin [Ascobolus immersus RN42]|uniref:Translin n=1 Tax=Ascobolus immersus RN42 TaxID=1160509 RepID=A0A3N4I1E3_ASCIM|nr:Translin [Ascobolus immersus RN42]